MSPTEENATVSRPVGTGTEAPRSRALLRRIALLLGVVVLLLLIVGFFAGKIVCSDAATDAGRVQVCRPLLLTDPPVVAAGVVVLMLFVLFVEPDTEFTGFGISLRGRVRAAEDVAARAETSAAAAQQAVNEATRAVREAQAAISVARSLADSAREDGETTRKLVADLEARLSSAGVVDRALASAERDPLEQEQSALEEIDRGAAEYDKVRQQPSGRARVAAADVIVGRMISRLDRVPDFPVLDYLESGSQGRRVAAYSWCYVHPMQARTHLKALVGFALEERDRDLQQDGKPHNYGQYQAFRAVRRVVEQSRSVGAPDVDGLDRHDIRRLREWLAAQGSKTTDRAREVQRILDLAR